MELTDDQERLVHAGAWFAGSEPEDFLSDCIRAGFDTAAGATWRTEDTATRVVAREAVMTIREAHQRWEVAKDAERARVAVRNGDSADAPGEPDHDGSPERPVLTKDSSIGEFAEALLDAYSGHHRHGEPVTTVQVAEATNLQSASGEAHHSARAAISKLKALGVATVQIGRKRCHERDDMVLCAREWLNESDDA